MCVCVCGGGVRERLRLWGDSACEYEGGRLVTQHREDV